MFNLKEFDFSEIREEITEDLSGFSKKSEDENDDMQIDSSTGSSQKKNDSIQINSPEQFHENASKYGLRDKIIIFGGW